MDYQVLQEIYRNAKVVIEKVRCTDNNQTYIQKTYLQNKNEALNAVNMLSMIHNQFILNIIEHFEDESEQLILIQEYCDQGDLRTFTQSHIGYKMQESIVWSIILQIAYAILELNEIGIHHRALIPENVLLLGRTEGYQVRITDFHKSSKQSLCQLPCAAIYLPHEYFFNGNYTQKSHIWQFGHILYFMVTQKLLFPSTSLESQVKEQLRRGRIQINISNAYSDGLINFINACLIIKENARPNILQLIRMKEFREAMDKPYYTFSLEQKRHLMKWINSTETTISKPILYSQNEFDLRSPRMINHDVTVKKHYKNDKLPEIYSKKQKSRSAEKKQLQIDDRQPQYKVPIAYTVPKVLGIVKPIHYHKKQQYELSQSLPKFSLPYVKELDGMFKTVMDNKKTLCNTWLGESDYLYLRSQINFTKQDKLLRYLEQKHPKLDGSLLLQQINDIATLEEQKKQRTPTYCD